MRECKLVYKKNSSLKEAIELLDKSGVGVLAVVDNNNKLIGIITDGDIRRGFLNKKFTLDDIINRNPITKNYRLSKKYLINFLKSIHRRHLPLVDENNKFIEMLILDEYEFNSKPNKVVIMAGGLGKRLGKLTKNVPKPMLPVGDKPILENIIRSFNEYGFNDFYISVNYKSDIIKNYFKNGELLGVRIKYLEENKKLGTAGSLKLITDVLKEPLFVINGDILTTLNYEELLKFHIKHASDMTICTREVEYQIPYGVINTKNGKITSLLEKPSFIYNVNAGIYVLNPSMLKFIPKNQYFDMTELIQIVLDKKYKILSYKITDYWLDIGKIDDYKKANKDLGFLNVV